MKKMGLNKDYITQLTRNLAKVERQHLISLNEIKSRMNMMEKSLKNNFKADSETLKLEEILQIKMAYMMLYIAYKEKYLETNADEDRLFEKQEIIELAHNIEQQSKKEYVKQKEERELNPRKYNEYKDLKVPVRSTIQEVNDQYEKKLSWWNSELTNQIENNKITKEYVIKNKTLFDILKDAHRNLEDENYKLQLDEILLFNFDPNQEQRYIPKNFAEITYIPEKKYVQRKNGSYQTPSYLAHNSDGDEIFIIQTGDLGYGRFRKKDGDVTVRSPYELKEYKVIKTYKNEEVAKKKSELNKDKGNEERNGEEFVVYGNINTQLLTNKQVDIEYIRYNNDVLLSTLNMDEAIEHNGGYIGEVYVDRQSREYVVYDDQDKLCLAKEFEKYQKEKGKENPADKAIRIRLDKKRTKQPEER